MDTLAPGIVVDRYRLVEPVGEGGQGSVWRAEDPLRPDVPIALKLVPIGRGSGATLDRFRREARVLARLSFPSLPQCHALFEDLKHDVVGLALDFVQGHPLSVLLASPGLTQDHRVQIVTHLASALAFIHDAGIVHRDVKPQNVMVADGFRENPADPSRIKLVDFGIAAEPYNPTPLTAQGGIAGTVAYLSPEIMDRGFWDGPVDGAERDTFALGVLAYELLHGLHPTHVGDGAAPGDYLVRYRELASAPDRWLEEIAGDPLEAFYRKCLALHSAERANHGRVALALLESAGGGARDPGAELFAVPARPRPQASQPEIGPTDLAVSTASSAAGEGRHRSRRVALVGTIILAGIALFGAAFATTYGSRGEEPRASLPKVLLGALPESPMLEEPPNPSVPVRATSLSTPAARSASPPLVDLSKLGCPKGMLLQAGPPPFCLDKQEVTVAEYRTCKACGPAAEAFWPGPTFTEGAKREQSKNCTSARVGLDNYPVNCVSWQDARAYCELAGKRLPHLVEWHLARGAVARCTEVGGVCPLFEWTGDLANQPGHRATRGPSFRFPRAAEGSNVETARNDDLGFRCARDSLPL